MSNKCAKCGLVNYQAAAKCSRCSSVLGSPVTGLNPFENEGKTSSGGMKWVVILVVAVIGGFAVYQFTKPDAKPSAVVANQPNANVMVPMMTAADIEKSMPKMTPFQPPTALTKDFKLTPEMIQNQQKAYRERFGKSY